MRFHKNYGRSLSVIPIQAEFVFYVDKTNEQISWFPSCFQTQRTTMKKSRKSVYQTLKSLMFSFLWNRREKIRYWIGLKVMNSMNLHIFCPLQESELSRVSKCRHFLFYCIIRFFVFFYRTSFMLIDSFSHFTTFSMLLDVIS